MYFIAPSPPTHTHTYLYCLAATRLHGCNDCKTPKTYQLVWRVLLQRWKQPPVMTPSPTPPISIALDICQEVQLPHQCLLRLTLCHL
jgi:hypothetical protein